VGAVIVVVVWVMNPSLLLANTAVTGGDTGAHVALAQFLKTNLLPHLRVSGWDPGAYDGFPLNTFYFPLPDTLAAIAGYIIPFNVAFKLVTILGSVTLPVAAWAFGRLAGLERPRPAVLALATLPFLFDQTFTIYGGNLFSTLAGEYAYSLGLSFALVFLGVAIYGMRTGRLRVTASLLLAACLLCHVLTAAFALVGVLIVFLLAWPSWRRLWWVVSAIGTGLLLVSWWIVPFVAERAYSNSMGWLNVTTFVGLLAPTADRWALGFAAVGLVFAIARRDRAGWLLCILGALSGLAVRFEPQWQLYNVRLLPFWWLCVYLMAGYAFAESGVLVVRMWRAPHLRSSDRPAPASSPSAEQTGIPLSNPMHRKRPRHAVRARRFPWPPGAVALPVLATVAALMIVVPDLVVSPSYPFSIGPVHIEHNGVTDWAQWNYSGYERKSGWAELHDGIVATLDRVDRRYGCGRAMWEYSSDLNRFGTPEALMDLPMWTGGCIDSMEGLLFESAASTPYHFLDQAELSAAPDDAMVGLPYGPLDVTLGVQHLQLLGVRYFLASSPQVQIEANADPELSLVATTGPWHTLYQGETLATTWKIYVVHDSSMVTALPRRPEVLVGVGESQSSWLPVAERWYLDPALWGTELTAGGPASWSRTSGVPDSADAGRPLPAVRVSEVRVSDDEINFHVDRLGVPVLVRVSYFPDWHATGAAGPWRAEPNLMVVIPSAHDVTLRYGPSNSGRLGDVLFLVGLLALVALVRRRNFVAPVVSG
jgi:hypothetical protein